MECEICGREIKGRGFKVIVEGSEVTVCARCKEHGAVKPEKIDQGVKKLVLKKKQKLSRPVEFTEELIENYHLIIKREREKRGWSQEVLAKKIQEKASLVRKIENAEITPEPEVVEKLEKLFNITLREKIPEIKIDLKKTNLTPTLGDVVVIKKKKR
ncbi:multiprotein bridging factor aMBF1 [Archaeoglobus veneficus]|uniref:Transcriptional regulator, XRE family n=1 Tax=Archaeoglobus veneficus (strain DSM 11195 / SNP6) TaxID=693661 RepID=F2KSW3_ARCVS|nr:multiprotein bridging factor aMBF1 [Archaeoglobus veneficus]AEA47008.1 transcriptional regulator, XRE family [Archaeoglobus veneficus SNP6]